MNKDSDRKGIDLRPHIERAVAGALFGEGCYPFNEATGFIVQHETKMVTDAVIEAFFEAFKGGK